MSTKGTLVLTTSVALVVALAVLLWLVFWAFGDGSGSGAGIGPAGSNNGSSEGIQVRGEWTIDIREPDGSLVSRHEFSNALTTGTSGGDHLLGLLLKGDKVPGEWSVEVGNSDVDKAPCRIPGSNFVNSCDLVEPDLTVSVPTSGTNANSLVLNGTTKASQDGEITFVTTTLRHCGSITAPDDCSSDISVDTVTGQTIVTSTGLTGTDVVPVLADQNIDVQVVLSFS